MSIMQSIALANGQQTLDDTMCPFRYLGELWLFVVQLIKPNDAREEE
jgi:hypothetical protein